MANVNGASKTASRSSSSPQGKGKGSRSPSDRGNTPQQDVGLPRKPTASKSVLGRFFSTVARIFIWYSIFVILVRCPASLEECDATSPRICKPYFQAKKAISPHAQKYYDAYAAPYVQVAQPYYDAVDRTVLTPTRTYAVKYAVPQLVKVQALGQAQWDKSIRPQLSKAQAAAASQYEQVLGPYVNKASTAVAPYYDIARNSALQTHYEVILPTYEFVAPYAAQGYSALAAFAVDTAIPSAVWTWNQASDFVDGTVWPQLRVLYADTVEPQLEKIGQRLSRSSDGSAQRETLQKTIQSAASSSFTKPTQPSSSSSATKSSIKSSSAATEPEASSTGSSTGSTTATSSATPSVAATEPPAGITEPAKLKRPESIKQDQPEPEESEERRKARETVAEDLKAWQEKYAKAADEGAAEIEQRVEEIAKRMIRRNARTTGKALVEALQHAVVGSLITLRRDIKTIAGSVRKGAATAEEGEEQITVVVRRNGVDVKEHAQAVRKWREEYSKELQDTVSRAAENHFQILGSIRDLALQKIGMKWAWMEGVTYKDWAKYHQLKNRFDEWEHDLEQLIVTHPGLEEAEAAGQQVEDEAMKLAQSAAKELARLKQVGVWKVLAGDDSDEFDSDATKAAAEAAQAEREAAKAAVVEEAHGSPVDRGPADVHVSTESAEPAGTDAVVEESETETVVIERVSTEEEAPAAATEAAEAAETASNGESANEAAAAAEDLGEILTSEAVPPPASHSTADEETATPASSSVETAGTETVATAAEADNTASTLTPEEVPIILGENLETPVVDEPQATTEPEVEKDEESVHLPVDEVVPADEVPLEVASSVSSAPAADEGTSEAEL